MWNEDSEANRLSRISFFVLRLTSHPTSNHEKHPKNQEETQKNKLNNLSAQRTWYFVLIVQLPNDLYTKLVFKWNSAGLIFV